MSKIHLFGCKSNRSQSIRFHVIVSSRTVLLIIVKVPGMANSSSFNSPQLNNWLPLATSIDLGLGHKLQSPLLSLPLIPSSQRPVQLFYSLVFPSTFKMRSRSCLSSSEKWPRKGPADCHQLQTERREATARITYYHARINSEILIERGHSLGIDWVELIPRLDRNGSLSN